MTHQSLKAFWPVLLYATISVGSVAAAAAVDTGKGLFVIIAWMSSVSAIFELKICSDVSQMLQNEETRAEERRRSLH